jgi:hypothetical protein
MGRFLEAERETWYLGWGSESLGRLRAGFFEDFGLREEVVFRVDDGAEVAGGVTASAFAGFARDEADLAGLLSARGCFEGSAGFGSGG